MPANGINLISDSIKHVDIGGSHVGGCSYYCLLGFGALKFGTEISGVLE